MAPFRDVTERESLQRRYRALIGASLNLIAVVSADGQFRYLSPSIERLLDSTPAEIEGRVAVDLVHEDDRVDLQRTIETPFESGGRRVVEHRAAHASGLGLWLVHWIVTKSGGDVCIELREERGTAVELWLPTA